MRRRITGILRCAPIDADDRLIGWVGLTPLEGHSYTQLLYGLVRKYWGQGLGTEAAAAMMSLWLSADAAERIGGGGESGECAVAEAAGKNWDDAAGASDLAATGAGGSVWDSQERV